MREMSIKGHRIFPKIRSRSPSPQPGSRSAKCDLPEFFQDTEPPPYSPPATLSPTAAQDRPLWADNKPSTPATSDKYLALKDVDTLFLIDDSGSMCGSNWEKTASALSAVVPVCVQYDSDGVGVYFLNNEETHPRVKSAKEVYKIFKNVKPFGPTPTGRRLGEILEQYLSEYKRNQNIKPLNIIVITDGEPTDPDRLMENIVKCARKLDDLKAKDRQIGIQFFQVGNDEDAMNALEVLDNALPEAMGTRDMVDTVSWKKMEEGKGLTSEEILKTVLGAMDKGLDRKRGR